MLKKEVIIVLDCCFSGGAGQMPMVKDNNAVIGEGLTILAGTRANQPGLATAQGSVFTNLLIEALDGGAADLLGAVTLSSAYAFVDRRLGVFDQRPMFKCHVSRFSDLRKCDERVDRAVLRRLTTYFSVYDIEYPLDPTYETAGAKRTPRRDL